MGGDPRTGGGRLCGVWNGRIGFSAVHPENRNMDVGGRSSGRDINAELWAASGWPKRRETSATISFAEADLFEFSLSRSELPEAKALVEAYANANEIDQYWMRSFFSGIFFECDIPRLPTIAYLSPELRAIVRAYCAGAGPPADSGDQLLGHFPTEKYVLRLLRVGRLIGRGSLPGETLARDLTADDWATLELVPGGFLDRICVWRRFPPAKDRNGDIEMVRVRSEEVLKEFPPDLPLGEPSKEAFTPDPPLSEPPKEASDGQARDLIRSAMEANGGYIQQREGAEIVRTKHPGFNKERAMRLVKELTGNTKRGPRGPRKKLSK